MSLIDDTDLMRNRGGKGLLGSQVLVCHGGTAGQELKQKPLENYLLAFLYSPGSHA